MNNKKLYAILTLVAFMITLMPVMAFAAVTGVTDLTAKQVLTDSTKLYLTFTKPGEAGMVQKSHYDGTTWSAWTNAATFGTDNTNVTVNNLTADTSYKFRLANGAEDGFSNESNVVKTVTVDTATMYADTTVANSRSVAYVTEGDIAVNTNETIQLRMMNKYGIEVDHTLNAAHSINPDNPTDGNIYVWVTKSGSNVPVETAIVKSIAGINSGSATVALLAGAANVYEISGAGAVVDSRATIDVQFLQAGSYSVHVSTSKPTMTSGTISGASEFTYTDNTVTVAGSTVNVKNYTATVTLPAAYNVFDETGVKIGTNVNNQTVKDGYTVSALQIEANNVAQEEVVLEFMYPNSTTPITNTTFTVTPVGAIDVSATEVTTNGLGQAKFKVSGSNEGTYKLYVSKGTFEITIEVAVGAVYANSIDVTDKPENAIDVLGTTDLSAVEFTMYDVNGNKLTPSNSTTQGWDKAANSTGKLGSSDVTGYVSIVSQPSASKLENKNLAFDGTHITTTKAITVEGTYTFKVVLNNGNYTTVTIEVKEFTTPVELVVKYPEAVELGSKVYANKIYWIDANKVEKSAAGRVTLAANGYAVADFNSGSASINGTTRYGILEVKTDEKYVGNTITITGVDERYNLIASTNITVADEATALAFATKTAEVKVNNKIRVNLVDSNGNKVALGTQNTSQANSATTSISYVITSKPANANVFANTVSGSDKLVQNGYFDMNLTSDTVGNVTVQAVVKYSYVNDNGSAQVKYYTGTQTFAVGSGTTGDVVVMTIGSNDIVVNDETVTTDAAPMVKDNRTFVPFRAGLEAFGAEVSYENNVVTAKLNGVTVAFTIDSTSYTVNDEVKTADVAPFISGDRTYVPVRFIAEAFGITVTPIYDAVTGGTSSVLFNL